MEDFNKRVLQAMKEYVKCFINNIYFSDIWVIVEI